MTHTHMDSRDEEVRRLKAEIERLTSLVEVYRAENYRLSFHEPTMLENRRLRQLLTLALDYVEHPGISPHGPEAAGSLVYSINEILLTAVMWDAGSRRCRRRG